jgi:hypothetical protein
MRGCSIPFSLRDLVSLFLPPFSLQEGCRGIHWIDRVSNRPVVTLHSPLSMQDVQYCIILGG